MRFFIFVAAALLLPTAARADDMPPDIQPFAQEITACIGGKLELRREIAQLKLQIESLKNAAAKPADPPAARAP